MIHIVRYDHLRQLRKGEEDAIVKIYRTAFDDELSALESKGLATTRRYEGEQYRASRRRRRRLCAAKNIVPIFNLILSRCTESCAILSCLYIFAVCTPLLF